MTTERASMLKVGDKLGKLSPIDVAVREVQKYPCGVVVYTLELNPRVLASYRIASASSLIPDLPENLKDWSVYHINGLLYIDEVVAQCVINTRVTKDPLLTYGAGRVLYPIR